MWLRDSNVWWYSGELLRARSVLVSESARESTHIAMAQSLTACYSAAFSLQSMQHVA